MKMLVIALCFACFMPLVAPVSAAERTFGPDFSRFTVDVPDGWIAKSTDCGCRLISPDGQSSFSIHVHGNDGKSAPIIAQAIAEDMEGNIKRIEKISQDKTRIHAEADGFDILITIVIVGDTFRVFTMIGNDMGTKTKIRNLPNPG
ncbi:MAG: hypothetical protein K6G15_05195 [Desulfovibrio sp.]|nr:hypothetical protein [Desulfovibrio sp.]